MKKFLLLLGMVLAVCSIIAQAPQAFNYQAIARDKAGNILSNHQVSIKIGILQGDIDGPAVYQETHTATTNDFGLINLSIGEGQRTTDGGSDELEGLSVVDWSQGPYFIKVEMDENGGSNYREMGTAELLSVPYALYAESSGDRNREADDDWGINGNHVYTGIASDPSCQSGNAGIGDSNPNAKLSVVMQDGFNSMFKRINNAPTSNALFLLRRARGTIGSETAVVNGDYIGQIGFEAFTGTQYKRAAGIFTQVDGPVTSAVVPGNIHFKTRNTLGVMNEHMRISSYGTVGIGTVDPLARKLSIYAGNNMVGLHVLNDHAIYATVTAINEGGGPVGYYYGGDFLILNGNVGIGSDTPGNPLDVVGIVNASNYFKNGSEFNEGKWSANGSEIYYNSGNVGIGTSNPGLNLDVIATDISWIRAKSLTSYAGLIIDKGNLSDNGYTIYRTAGLDKWYAGLIGDDNFSISKNHSPTDGTFYISSAKNVGIGTSNPSGKLHVHGGPVSFYTTGGSNSTRARFVSSGSDVVLYLYDQNNDMKIKIHSDGPTYFNGGNVGIGCTNPDEELVVGTPLGLGWAVPAITVGGSSGGGIGIGTTTYNLLLDASSGFGRARIISSDAGGYGDGNIEFTCNNIGIGSGAPAQHLEVYGSGNQYARITSSNHSIAGLELIRSGASYYDWKIENSLNDLYFKYDANEFASTSTTAMYYDRSDHSLKFYKSDGTTVAVEIDADYGGDGRIITDELQITGGADIAEPFEISSQEDIKPGMVVSIDKDFPGKLKVAGIKYDRCVAGIISGAGNVKTGLFLQDKGTEADGEYPVALTGRVYCWADATHGAIEPGDLLTTSATPGHAMKVTDYGKAQGAILGKAMSGLEEGKGLVFVLVTLQ